MSKEVSLLVAALSAPLPPKGPLQHLRAEVAADPALREAILTASRNGRSQGEIAAILTEHMGTEITQITMKRWLSENR